MNGALSIVKKENGQRLCIFTLPRREDVTSLTLDLIDAGFDVLYEPRYSGTKYESCILCGEETYIRIISDGK